MADHLDVDSPESLAWQGERSSKAEVHLDGLASRSSFFERIAANLADTRLAPVVARGGRWFQSAVLEAGDDQPVIVVRDSPAGSPRVLVDPNEISAKRGVPCSVVLSSPSPDGRTFAYTLMQAGAEAYELGLVDVESGTLLPDEIALNVTGLSWLADSSGFYASALEVADGAVGVRLYEVLLGSGVGAALKGPDGLLDMRPFVSADGAHIAVASGNTEQRLDWIVQDGQLEPFLDHVAGGVTGGFHGDDFFALLDGGAPRGRLVRIPVATASDRTTWTELVAESDDVLRYVQVVGDVVVLGYLRDATAGLRLLDLEGVLLEEVALPSAGTVSAYPYGASHPAIPMFVTGDDEISFIHSSFTSSWGVYRYVLSERRLEVLTPPAITLDGLTVSTVTPTSKDGSALPTHVVHRSDLDMSVPQPTLVYGYGGFNMSNLPSFAAENAAWIEAGGVFVLSHLRGGSEFGAQWWSEGTRATKQRTFDDLYAVAEHLLDTGVTTREQLALKGESNGGLLAGVAITQRQIGRASCRERVYVLV